MTYYHKISSISKIHSIDLFTDNKKYYIIGDRINNNQCGIKCDQINQQPIGSECIDFDALLSNWLIYNNDYYIPTRVYFNTDNQELVNHFKNASLSCYQRDNKCPYYPNVNVEIFDAIDKNISLSKLTDLIQYYVNLSLFFTNQDTNDFFENLSEQIGINTEIKEYGSTYINFIDQLIEDYNIAYAELFLIYNKTGKMNTKKFIDHYVNILNRLQRFLNNLEILSSMMNHPDKIFIVITNEPDHLTLFLKKYMNHEFSLISNQNCITIKSDQIYADEYRWYRFKNMKSIADIKKMKIKNFNVNTKLQRSGVIPYTYRDDELYFLFGVDKEYQEWTDFGGKIERKENALTAGLRELKEESLGIIDLKIKDIQEGIITYDDKMAILFVYIPYNKSIINNFKNKLKFAKKVEVYDMVWLSLTDLKKELYKDKIYTRVKHHLLKAKNFYELLD